MIDATRLTTRAPAEPLRQSRPALERLAQPAQMYSALTREVLLQAGISAGMRVLDVRCRDGDVTMEAAELVGPSGSIVAVDRSIDHIGTARRRTDRIPTEIIFHEADLYGVPRPWSFDAVIGRLVLMYQNDQISAVRQMGRYVRPGGTIVLQEMDLARGADSLPPCPLWDAIVSIVRETYFKSGVDIRTGRRLLQTFRAAGLEPAGSYYAARLENGPGADMYAILTAMLRSVLPIAETFGLLRTGEVDLNTLEERLRDEGATLDASVTTPVFVGVWATV